MNRHLFLSVAAAGLLVVGCRRETRIIIETTPPAPTPLAVARTDTFETRALGREIDTFERTPSMVQSARVKKAFAELDGEIAELVEYVAKKTGDGRAEAARKLADLRAYRGAENARFLRLDAQIPREVRVDAETTESARREGVAEKIGGKIDDAAKKVEEGVKDVVEAVRENTR